MEINAENYFRKRYSMFKWRSETSTINKLILAFSMACVTGILAQIVIPLPWTPVPITGQTLAVLLAGVLLGRWWGGMSQAIYICLGIAGLPWFAGMIGGYGVLLGATGGYMVGFILAALFLGYFVDRYAKARNFRPMLALMFTANFGLIYIPGLIGLGFWLYLVNGSFPTIWTLITLGLLPFLVGDIVKIGSAAAITKILTPKKPL